jgi:hypothetical protein
MFNLPISTASPFGSNGFWQLYFTFSINGFLDFDHHITFQTEHSIWEENGFVSVLRWKDQSGTFFIGVLSRCLPPFHTQGRNRSNFQNIKFCLDRNPVVLNTVNSNTVTGCFGYMRKTYKKPNIHTIFTLFYSFTYMHFLFQSQNIFLFYKLLCFWPLSTVLLLFKTYNISKTGFCLRLLVESEIMR